MTPPEDQRRRETGSPCFRPGSEDSRRTADDWGEEMDRQARRLAEMRVQVSGLFTEFRRKLATGETLSRAMEKLAEALRFSGRITLTFHQGKLTKTTLEECFVRSGACRPDHENTR